MAEADSDALLLDRIVGKYGEGSDYDDIGNADEDALLEDDDPDFAGVKHSTLYHDESEELDHEPEEPDTEDVLDLEAQDVELEDEMEESKNLGIPSNVTVSSTTQLESDVSLQNRSELEERERNTDRFKNERQGPALKSYNIPDSLDEVSVPVSTKNNRNGQRMGGQFRGRGRGGNHRNQMQKNRSDNKTVLINPHFKGHVKINNDTRLAWDARQRINQKNQGLHQVGRVTPFAQNSRKNQNMAHVQPWMNNHVPNMPQQNIPQYQPPPLYQPSIQQPQQVATWNQYQPNSYNQVPPQQMGMQTQQNVFMQPLPQNLFTNHPPPPFNQPTPQYAPNQPMYPNMNSQSPPMFGNPQFMQPNAQQYHQPMEQGYPQGFNGPPPLQYNQDQYMQPPNQITQVNNRFVSDNQPNNQFHGNQRFVRPKTNFNQGKAQFNQKISPNKRKAENVELRKKKRNLASTNLHEVRTIETPDTTVKEDRAPTEEEDEETREYRKQIEEQKRKREELLALKEERRKLAVLQQKNPSAVNVPSVDSNKQQPKPRQIQQRNLQVVRTNQPVRTVPGPLRSQSSASSAPGQQLSNVKVISTDSDESSYDKQHLTSFLSNRKILTKDQSLVDTSIVVVSNLAAGTTDVKLRKMCQGIGDIKKLQMSPKERQATIQFNSVASAHAFFKKYQRTMLDLSMIQVTLKPMS